MATERRSKDAGYSLVALMASMTIMLILMGVAAPSWRYVMQDMREEELIFRGNQIAEAVERYQRKNGNTFPPSMEVLVKGKYLRKEFKDPFAKDGKWRVLKPGEATITAPAPIPGLSGQASAPPAVPRLPGSEATVAGQMGPIAGVISKVKLKGYRKFNGKESYNEWAFVAGQPRNVGNQTTLPMRPLPGLPGGPNTGPGPVPGGPPGPGGPLKPPPGPGAGDS